MRGEELMDNTERKLKKLFDFQKFEKEPGLQSVIDDVKQDRAGINRLSDDDLEFVAGGAGKGAFEDDPQANGRCKVKGCSGYLQKLPGGGYICSNCGQVYDKNRQPVTKGSGFDLN